MIIESKAYRESKPQMGCPTAPNNLKIAPNGIKQQKYALTFLIHRRSSSKAPTVARVFVYSDRNVTAAANQWSQRSRSVLLTSLIRM